MPKSPLETPQGSESIERGKNVLVSIDLIRHPEKDHKTGKLTAEGKERFFQELGTDFGDGEEYDTIKFYVSTLSRGQEAKEPITRFLEATEINTAIRSRPELVGKFLEVNAPVFKEEMTGILEKREALTSAQIAEVNAPNDQLATHEPATKDFETKANEVLIKEFFDTNLPGAEFTGREHAQVVKGLIDHFCDLAKRLKEDSKVKLVLVSHSGVIEYLTKYVYLQNHPEIKPEDVDVETIGGLVDFTQGPEITIQSDENGEQKVNFKFGGQFLTYTPNE